MNLIKSEIIEENGLKYQYNEYDNGTTEKCIICEDTIQIEPELSETEETIMDMNTKVSYIECLMELSGGGLIDKLKRLMQHCLA